MKTTIAASVGIILLLALAYPCTAMTTGEEIYLKTNYLVALILCAIWIILGLVATVTLILSGITYLTTEDTRERNNAKSRILKVFVGLVIVLAACPIINYLSHGTRIEEFKCDCPPTPPPRTCYESHPDCDGYCPTGYGCVEEEGECICGPGLTTTTTIPLTDPILCENAQDTGSCSTLDLIWPGYKQDCCDEHGYCC